MLVSHFQVFCKLMFTIKLLLSFCDYFLHNPESAAVPCLRQRLFPFRFSITMRFYLTLQECLYRFKDRDRFPQHFPRTKNVIDCILTSYLFAAIFLALCVSLMCKVSTVLLSVLFIKGMELVLCSK